MPFKILLAEDEDGARKALARILEDEGYQVLEASDGEQALKKLRTGSAPDLIILDMLMPVLDGWHFLEELKRQKPRPNIPIIITTATVLTREWAEENGCQGFVAKPIERDELLNEIRRCLAR